MEIQEYTIPRVIGVKQAAAEFGIAEYAIRTWIKSGQLPVVHCGRKHLINCTVLSRFLSGELTTEQNKIRQAPVNVGDCGRTQTKNKTDLPQKNRNGKSCKVMPPIK